MHVYIYICIYIYIYECICRQTHTDVRRHVYIHLGGCRYTGRQVHRSIDADAAVDIEIDIQEVMVI